MDRSRNLFVFAGVLLLGAGLDTFTLFAAPVRQVEFPSEDKLKVTADLYFDGQTERPFVLLFHQARSSRGEYGEIAPLLQARSINSMAVDLRSGRSARGVRNETAARAAAASMATGYLHAEPDMRASVRYVRSLGVSRILLWGSSYSASLAIKLAGEANLPLAVAGVIAFSPGEYFGRRNFIGKYAGQVRTPAFVTCAKSEVTRVRPFYERIAYPRKTFFVPRGAGAHGSRALWSKSPDHAEYRAALFAFLDSFR